MKMCLQSADDSVENEDQKHVHVSGYDVKCGAETGDSQEGQAGGKGSSFERGGAD